MPKKKVKKFHGDSVKNESARAKKLEGGAKRPPPSLYRVNKTFRIILACSPKHNYRLQSTLRFLMIFKRFNHYMILLVLRFPKRGLPAIVSNDITNLCLSYKSHFCETI